MNSVWYALLWKEWREHRLVLAVLAALFVAVPLMRSLDSPEDFFDAVTIELFAIPLVGMFLAMHIAAREQSQGTIRFLQALPVSGRRPAIAKLFWATITIAAPVALAVAAAAVWAQLHSGKSMPAAADLDLTMYGSFWRIDDWYVARLLAPCLGGASVMLWMAAGGVNRSDEVRAGAIGFLIMLCAWAAFAATEVRLNLPSSLEAPAAAALPGGVVMAGNLAPRPVVGSESSYSFWPIALSAGLSHAALAAWYIFRFGRITPARVQAKELPAKTADRTWLAPPRSSPLAAMAWKQTRDLAPLALLGACSIVAITLMIAWWAPGPDERIEPSDLAMMTMAVWMMVGFGVATVAGVGVFIEDLQPGIHTFWRSRPINVNQWFAVKYVAGLLITLVSLAAGALAIEGYLAARHGVESLAPRQPGGSPWIMFGVGLMVQFGLFSAAVAAMALLRQAVYAAIGAIAAAGVMSMAVGEMGDRLAPNLPVATVIALVISICMLAALGAAVLAWLAVRNDWGWKR